jgi:hypothetical protein
MIHHRALKGMEMTIVVHMMLHLLYCSTYGHKTQKMGGKKRNPRVQSIFYTLYDGFQKYLRGVSTLEPARDSV